MSAHFSAPAGGFRYYLNMLRRRSPIALKVEPCRAEIGPPT